jgi:hypothetical protein
MRRWKEEYMLVQEEMRRSVVYLHWKEAWWRDRALLPLFKLSNMAHGVLSYAAKQADLCQKLGVQFSQAWEPVLSKLGLQPKWEERISHQGQDTVPENLGSLAGDDELDSDPEHEELDLWEDNGDVEEEGSNDFELDEDDF